VWEAGNCIGQTPGSADLSRLDLINDKPESSVSRRSAVLCAAESDVREFASLLPWPNDSALKFLDER
jgi:hypothetical protein